MKEPAISRSQTSRATAIWLAAVAVVIVAMVVVGGATRATGSGLSITQWRPVSGVIPPLNGAAWEHLFALYRQIPQYRLINRGMSLAEFQTIFWWEWTHRLLGRLLGLVFFVPFVILVTSRRLPTRLIGRCAALFGLGALQGFVGWWMVASGLEFRTSVAPERLATHLGLALILLSALIWTALEAWFGPPAVRGSPSRSGRAAAGLLGAVFLQCLLGALTAGNHAGLVDADWPMMAGRVVPIDYWQGSVIATVIHGAAAVQFNHRVMAYFLAVYAAVLAVVALRHRWPAAPIATAILVLVVIQMCLGVAALWLTVPLPLALAHQFTGVAIFVAATVLAWRMRRSQVS